MASGTGNNRRQRRRLQMQGRGLAVLVLVNEKGGHGWTQIEGADVTVRIYAGEQTEDEPTSGGFPGALADCSAAVVILPQQGEGAPGIADVRQAIEDLFAAGEVGQ